MKQYEHMIYRPGIWVQENCPEIFVVVHCWNIYAICNDLIDNVYYYILVSMHILKGAT